MSTFHEALLESMFEAKSTLPSRSPINAAKHEAKKRRVAGKQFAGKTPKQGRLEKQAAAQAKAERATGRRAGAKAFKSPKVIQARRLLHRIARRPKTALAAGALATFGAGSEFGRRVAK